MMAVLAHPRAQGYRDSLLWTRCEWTPNASRIITAWTRRSLRLLCSLSSCACMGQDSIAHRNRLSRWSPLSRIHPAGQRYPPRSISQKSTSSRRRRRAARGDWQLLCRAAATNTTTTTMRFLARPTALPTPLVAASAVLTLVLLASVFQHEAVLGLGEGVAQRARNSYQEVKQKISSSSFNSDGKYLEPEWQFAKDISIVYTWVNGSDPAHRALKQEHTQIVDGERDRDNDELRHSFRAFNKFLPWHSGTVYLVTPGHVPNWLDTGNPRLKVINQNDLLEPSDIPTFNSNCLESMIHKIPGLTEKFIVLNDDYFFAKLVHPSDFFTTPNPISGEFGIKMFLEPWTYGIAENWAGNGQWPTSVRNTASAIKDAYEEIFAERTRITEHAPFVFDKRAFEGIHHRFNVHLRRNCRHKARAPDDIIPPFLHHQYIIQEGSRCCGIKYEIHEKASTFFQWTLDLKRDEHEFTRITKEVKPTFFNINDKMGSTDQDKILVAQNLLKRSMEEWLPDPSEFEVI